MGEASKTSTPSRAQWGDRWGFILACIGSAVGMAHAVAVTFVKGHGHDGSVLTYFNDINAQMAGKGVMGVEMAANFLKSHGITSLMLVGMKYDTAWGLA